MLPFAMFGRGVLILSLGAFCLLQLLWHVSYKEFLNSSKLMQRILILGTGKLAKLIGEVITLKTLPYLLVGYVKCGDESMLVPPQYIVGNGDGLLSTAKKHRVNMIVVSMSERRGNFPLKDVLSCKLSGIKVVDALTFYEQGANKLLIENTDPSWFIFGDGFRITTFLRIYKRAFDIILSSIGLIITLPIIPLIATLLKITTPGTIFFRQARVGVGEKDFVLYKFRTMQNGAESDTGPVWAQVNDPRVTRFGKFLRKTRLDEIPQLYNVLKGDMSFIGPRPERPEFVKELKEIIPYYSERHFIKPGITGWAQVKYRYGSSVEDTIEKLKYDLFYIKHVSFFLELQIMLETTRVVALGRGGR